MENLSFYLLLGAAGIVIAVLAGRLLYYPSQLSKCRHSLVRCINEKIEMKEKLPEYELPYYIGRDELRQKLRIH